MKNKKLKPIHSITVEDALDHGIIDKRLRSPPPGVLQHVWNKGHGWSGAEDLSWYRGEHAGIYSAYLTLRKAYPAAAASLIQAFGMNEKGHIGGSS